MISQLTNILNSKKYQDMSIDEILNSNPEKTLSVKTVNKYLNFASGLFKYACKHYENFPLSILQNT